MVKSPKKLLDLRISLVLLLLYSSSAKENTCHIEELNFSGMYILSPVGVKGDFIGNSLR